RRTGGAAESGALRARPRAGEGWRRGLPRHRDRVERHAAEPRLSPQARLRSGDRVGNPRRPGALRRVSLAGAYGTHTSRSVSVSRGVPPAAVVRVMSASLLRTGTTTATDAVQCSLASSGGWNVTDAGSTADGPSAATARDTSGLVVRPRSSQRSIASG